jgi:hypothetical protein
MDTHPANTTTPRQALVVEPGKVSEEGARRASHRDSGKSSWHERQRDGEQRAEHGPCRSMAHRDLLHINRRVALNDTCVVMLALIACGIGLIAARLAPIPRRLARTAAPPR